MPHTLPTDHIANNIDMGLFCFGAKYTHRLAYDNNRFFVLGDLEG